MKLIKRCLPVVVLAIVVGVLAVARERRISALETEYAARNRTQG